MLEAKNKEKPSKLRDPISKQSSQLLQEEESNNSSRSFTSRWTTAQPW
jgi:hypothetical protein